MAGTNASSRWEECTTSSSTLFMGVGVVAIAEQMILALFIALVLTPACHACIHPRHKELVFIIEMIGLVMLHVSTLLDLYIATHTKSSLELLAAGCMVVGILFLIAAVGQLGLVHGHFQTVAEKWCSDRLEHLNCPAFMGMLASICLFFGSLFHICALSYLVPPEGTDNSNSNSNGDGDDDNDSTKTSRIAHQFVHAVGLGGDVLLFLSYLFYGMRSDDRPIWPCRCFFCGQLRRLGIVLEVVCMFSCFLFASTVDLLRLLSCTGTVPFFKGQLCSGFLEFFGIVCCCTGTVIEVSDWINRHFRVHRAPLMDSHSHVSSFTSSLDDHINDPSSSEPQQSGGYMALNSD